MKNILNFLIEINKLKEMPRRGWVIRRVENPETIAEHTFRMTLAVWLLGQKKKLNIRKAIKIALFHDLCEIYSGDITPFFYYLHLPRNEKKRTRILMKWVRLSEKEKKRRGNMKFGKEKNALLKLIKNFPQKKEIFNSWLDYEKGISREGKFVKQIDRIEPMIQAIEYFGVKGETLVSAWWEEVEEVVEDPLLWQFLKTMQKKFYKNKKIHGGYKKTRELEGILNFLLKIGKLKRLPRLYWLKRKVKKPETVAEHIFTLSLMAWIFGKQKKELNLEKLLKMALCHELSAVYTNDTTPYDKILPRDTRAQREIFKKWPRLSQKEKLKIFLKDFKEEKEALKKLTSGLKPPLRKEMVGLWQEYRTKSSPEGYFLSQLNVLSVLLQALLYEKKYKNFSAGPIWEWAFEICDDPITIKLMAEMKKKFY